MDNTASRIDEQFELETAQKKFFARVKVPLFLMIALSVLMTAVSFLNALPQ